MLSGCATQDICDYLNAGGAASVFGNQAGCNSVQDIDIACAALLPVELISFEARSAGAGTVLNWVTESEKNNDYFGVEHSINGLDFRELARVDGHGTTFEKQYYEFIHDQPAAGANYYRLKQVDYNGQAEYTHIIRVSLKGTDLTVFPNPSAGAITLLTGNEEILSVKVTDTAGKRLITQNISAGTSLDVSALLPGVYLLDVLLENGRQHRVKIIRQF